MHLVRFNPSGRATVCGYGAAGGEVAAETANVVVGTAGGFATGAAAGTTAAGLVTAGGAAAAVPVAGWIAGGVLAAAGGTIALVAALKGGKARKSDAIKMAKDLGFGEEAEQVPAFTVGALRWPKSKRLKKLEKLRAKYARKKDKKGLFPKAHARTVSKIRAKIRILEAIGKVNDKKPVSREERKGLDMVRNAPKVAPGAGEMTPTQLSKATAGGALSEVPTWAWVAGGGAALLLIVAMTSKGGGGGGPSPLAAIAPAAPSKPSKPRSFRRVRR